MDMSEILDSLNDAQKTAVSTQAQRTLVLAGAGSGKTRVLVHRIGWLLEAQGLSPYRVLAVTFTNKAAQEMRTRIEALLNRSVQGMWVGTFHSIAHRLLRMHWEAAGLPEQFQILDSEDQLRLIKRTMQTLQVDEERWPPKQVQWFINNHKDEGRRAEKIDNNTDQQTLMMLRIYQAYEDNCQRAGLVDFAELLLRAYELWLKQPDLLEHYSNRFEHVLVDEFQDTNTIQYAWLKCLIGEQGQVTVVGDDDQSIYGWRGAKIENIQLFEQDFKGTHIIRLEQNYRSTETILRAANAIIAHNDNRMGKELWTQGCSGDPIALYTAFNEVDEARYVASRIKALAEQDHAYRDTAILYRSNAQSRVLEEALLREGLPYRIFGGLRFFERAEIKNALCYLRLMFNTADDAAFERIVAVPPRGIGERTLQEVREYAKEQQLSMWVASEQIIKDNRLSARAARALQAFLEQIIGLSERVNVQKLAQLVEAVISEVGLLAYHQKEKGEKGRVRIENLKELVSAAKEFESVVDDQEHSQLLALFLDHTALESRELQADAFEDSVQMMTLHTAKGLEFPVVFLVGLEEGLFPHQMSRNEPGRLEEERRLCYVGITRAMQHLYLTYAETRRLYGREKRHVSSRFIREIPKELIEEVRMGSKVSRPMLHNTESMPMASSEAEAPFSLGQRVLHQMFGEGTVLGFEGSGQNARVQVNFDVKGSKWLVLNYAKLESTV